MDMHSSPLPQRYFRGILRAFNAFRDKMRKQSAARVRQRLDQREVSIRISERWNRLCRSKLAALAMAGAGVSVSFAPYFLYLYGRGLAPLGPEPWGIIACWMLIVGPVMFYIKLGHHVMTWVRNTPSEPSRGSA